MIDMTEKLCRSCDVSKPVTDFNRRVRGTQGRTYLRSQCRACESAKSVQRVRDYSAAVRSEKKRRENLVRLYGITAEEYDARLQAQGGVCALCSREPGQRRLAVDHDHETGHVRALLCDPCNTALGLLQEDPDLLRRAAGYIEAGKGLTRGEQH